MRPGRSVETHHERAFARRRLFAFEVVIHQTVWRRFECQLESPINFNFSHKCPTTLRIIRDTYGVIHFSPSRQDSKSSASSAAAFPVTSQSWTHTSRSIQWVKACRHSLQTFWSYRAPEIFDIFADALCQHPLIMYPQYFRSLLHNTHTNGFYFLIEKFRSPHLAHFWLCVLLQLPSDSMLNEKLFYGSNTQTTTREWREHKKKRELINFYCLRVSS